MVLQQKSEGDRQTEADCAILIFTPRQNEFFFTKRFLTDVKIRTTDKSENATA
jgi:hypothetical protein